MAPYLGDFALSATVHFLWSTNGANGASITRATNGTVQVYKNNGTTQSTTGVTDTEDFDSLTGVHACTIDLSSDGTFYSTGANFTVVLSGATIDSQTVNAVLAHFSINNRSDLRPTTAGRTLDVSAGGEAGVDWANVGSPTTAVNLSATNFDTDQVVASVSGSVGSVTGNVGGNVVGSVASVTGNVAGSVASVTGNVGGNVVGSVASVTGNVAGNVSGSVGSLAAQAKADVNAEVVDALATDTYAEPSSVPAATASLATKVGFVAALARNKVTQTSTTQTLRNDADSGNIGTSTHSDDGTTHTRGEWA